MSSTTTTTTTIAQDVPLKALDKSIFSKTSPHIALKVPKNQVSSLVKQLNGHLLAHRACKPVMTIPNDDAHRYIILSSKYSKLEDAPEAAKAFPFDTYPVSVDYSHFTAEQVLHQIMPANSEVPSSFEQVGHIAHLNLKDAQLPYRFIIGQVLLDKNPSLKTVVNKMMAIETKFREFKMEIIAGIDDMDVDLREHGCRFKFNYSQVYWNSRLSTEHQRLLKFFTPKSIVCDMFAGVGPFAIPAAVKHKCQFHANDLNPYSYKYLKQNAELNKVEKHIHAYNMDARDFVQHLVQNKIAFDHVIMNLPGSAVEFLDVFKGLYNNASSTTTTTSTATLPIIHCYTFVVGKRGVDDFVSRAKESVENVLGEKNIEYVDIFDVRDVAPKKNMFCVSFKLPASIAYLKKRKLSDASSEQEEKKIKLSEN